MDLTTTHRKQTAVIALGSNLSSAAGNRAANLDLGVTSLRSLGAVLAVSSYYDTPPVGYLDQPRFLNAAALFETDLEPLHLLDRLLEIERALGRDRSTTVAKGPRVIDLDLILYGQLVLETARLTLPHPAMRGRRFVLEPLAEIAPAMIDPVTGCSIAELFAALPNEERIPSR